MGGSGRYGNGLGEFLKHHCQLKVAGDLNGQVYWTDGPEACQTYTVRKNIVDSPALFS